jgi:hypothetical protein
MTEAEPHEPEPEEGTPTQEKAKTKPKKDGTPKQEKAETKPNAGVAVPEETSVEPEPTPSGRRRRRPTIIEMGAFVGIVGGLVTLFFKFMPGCEPQRAPVVITAEISGVHPLHPVSFRRFLQRQQIPIPPNLTPRFLARRGIMVEFHYEIIGASGKHLRLSWELSDKTTNDRVAAEQSAYNITPSKYDDSGDWAIWIPAPKPGRNYYATVTIFKPQGPPYQLTHFDTSAFPGFAST